MSELGREGEGRGKGRRKGEEESSRERGQKAEGTQGWSAMSKSMSDPGVGQGLKMRGLCSKFKSRPSP